MVFFSRSGFVCLLVIFSVIGSASAESMEPKTFGLYNTGVNDFGAPLIDISFFSGFFPASDPHYNVIASPPESGYNGEAFKVIEVVVPGAWVANNSISTWISPGGYVGIESNDAVPYTYRTTFNLSGLPLNSIVVYGRFAADDSMTDVRINGISTGISGGGFAGFTNFTISSGFQAGVNTLDFDVVNNQAGGVTNPSGLRVEFTNVEVTPVLGASGLRFLVADRKVLTKVDLSNGMGGQLVDTNGEIAPDFATFSSIQSSQAFSGGASGQSDADQDSQLLGAIVNAVGHASSSTQGYIDPDNSLYDIYSFVTSLSFYEVEFFVDNLSYFHLAGQLGISDALASVSLAGPAGGVFAASAAGTFSRIVTLEPGQYRLTASADAANFSLDATTRNRSASFTMTFQSVAGITPGDINADGYVNAADLVLLAGQWLNANCDGLNNYCNQTDINQDGRVDMDDFAIIATNWTP